MARYYVPDALVCLGGGGIEVGQDFMSQEWILREVMGADPHPSGPCDEGPGTLDAYFIDTEIEETVATEFVEHEDDDIDTFSDLVDSVSDDVEGAPQEPEVTAINLTERTRSDWLEVASLTADNIVRDEFAETGIKAWWLSDETDWDQEPILDPVRNNFAQGVQARRGLTKALYRISQADSDPIGDIDVEPRSVNHTALVAGLGGGSGSGLLLDVARRLADDTAVTLFAILPRTSRDGTKVFQNAYATLSELEYLTLSNESPFANIVLLPYDAADSSEDFDRAAVNAILAHYNMDSDPVDVIERYEPGEGNGPPRWAPFTVAVPQVFRFLKEDIDESKDNFEDYIEELKAAQDAEEALYDRLEAFIDEYYPDAKNPNTEYKASDTTIQEIADRYITSLRDLVDQPVMDDLGYESAENFREKVDTFRSDVDDDQDETRRLVEQFPNETTRADLEPAELEENEREFIDVVADNLSLASRRFDLYRMKAYIRSEPTDDAKIQDFLGDELDGDISENVADDLEKALGRDDTGGNRNLTERFLSPIDDKESAVSDQIGVIEHLKQGAENRADTLAGTWADEVGDKLEAYRGYKRRAETAKSLLDDLETAIQNRLKTAERTAQNSVDDLDVRGPDFESYDDLKDALEAMGIDPIEKSTVEGAVKQVMKARKAQLKIASHEGSLWESAKQVARMGKIPKLEGEYGGAVRQLDADVITGVTENPGGTFDPSIAEALIDARKKEVETKDQDLLDDLAGQFERLAERPSDYRDRLKELAAKAEAFDPDESSAQATTVFDPDSGVLAAALDPDDPASLKDVRESLKDDLEERIDWTDEGPHSETAQDIAGRKFGQLLVEPFGTAKSDREDLRDKINRRWDAYTELSGDPDTNDDRGILGEEGNEFANKVDAVRDLSAITVYEDSSGEQKAFLTQDRPDNPARIGASDDLSSTGLLDHSAEKSQLKRLLSDMASRTLQTKNGHLPLREYRPDAEGHDVNPAVYDQHRGNLVVMSRLFDSYTHDDFESEAIEEIRRNVEDYFNFHQDQGFNSVQGEFADRWDVTFTYFIGGVFLDNVQPMRDFDDYVDQWEKHDGEEYLHPFVARHTFGIDGLTESISDFVPDEKDGAFTHRQELLNPSHADDVVRLLDGDAVSELRDLHHQTGFESVVDGLNDE